MGVSRNATEKCLAGRTGPRLCLSGRGTNPWVPYPALQKEEGQEFKVNFAQQTGGQPGLPGTLHQKPNKPTTIKHTSKKEFG